MKSQKSEPIKMTSPKIGISSEQLTTYLVDLDKVKLFESEMNNLPLFFSFLFFFLGLLAERLLSLILDGITLILLLVTLIFLFFSYRANKRKTDAWNKLEQEKINLYEGLGEKR